MNTIRRYIGCVVIIILLSASFINAEEKAAPSTVKAKAETDARLSQKLTYSAKQKAVKLIVADISEITGVKLACGANSSDWKVRDRRMNVFVKDASLGAVMRSIAHVMSFKWAKRDNDGVPVYRLIIDKKKTEAAEAGRQARSQAYQKELVNRREQTLADLEAISNLSEDELLKLSKSHPAAFLYATTGEAAMTTALARELPEFKAALMSGNSVEVSASGLSPAGQDALLQGVGGLWDLATCGGSDHWNPLPAETADGIANTVIRLNPQPSPSGESMSFLNRMEIQCADGRKFISFLPNIYDPLQDAYAVGTLRCLEENVGGDDMWWRPEYTQVFASAHKKMNEEFEPFDTAEPKIEHPDEPWMHEKLKQEIKGDLANVEELFAEHSEFSMVSDSFYISNAYCGIKADTEIGEALKQLTDPSGYEWKREKSFLELRDREWLKRREAQLPDSLIESWEAKVKQTGTLGIEDLAVIACVSREQMWESMRPSAILGEDKFFSALSSVIRQCGSLLKLYSTLTAAQLKSLYSSEGIRTDHMTADQNALVQEAIKSKPQMAMGGENALVIFCMPGSEGDTQTYKFKVASVTPDGPVAEFSFSLPKYIPPEKKTSSSSDKDKGI